MIGEGLPPTGARTTSGTSGSTTPPLQPADLMYAVAEVAEGDLHALLRQAPLDRLKIIVHRHTSSSLGTTQLIPAGGPVLPDDIERPALALPF